MDNELYSDFAKDAEFSPEKLDRDQAFVDTDQSDYLWCLHCERAYKKGWFRKVGDLQMCPYDGCDGDSVIDGWDWAQVRENNPANPEEPEHGVRYSQH